VADGSTTCLKRVAENAPRFSLFALTAIPPCGRASAGVALAPGRGRGLEK